MSFSDAPPALSAFSKPKKVYHRSARFQVPKISRNDSRNIFSVQFCAVCATPASGFHYGVSLVSFMTLASDDTTQTNRALPVRPQSSRLSTYSRCSGAMGARPSFGGRSFKRGSTRACTETSATWVDSFFFILFLRSEEKSFRQKSRWSTFRMQDSVL